MKILLHVCCGPCTVYPLEILRREGMEVTGFFYNPNIHPFREFSQRLQTLEELARQEQFPVAIDRDYGLRDFLRKVVFHEEQRCGLCYEMRLAATAAHAAGGKADAFTTTLLYSRYQNHELIRQQGEALGKRYGVPFYYQDFRRGWQEGIDKSIAMGLYRQPYCGCIYSEQERFDKKWRQGQPG
ncbi:MAG: epoxyqueuosine reductase QueH [Deltaproteobacteria bacterium]|nr:epoxyqueuosine reductase QueH [Deltaproteobacteria bacterium]